MKSLVIRLFVLVAAVLVLARLSNHSSANQVAPESRLAVSADEGTKNPVIVELFTSEGCSDCPAADALLARLDQNQPVPGARVIILEEHVDYWDHQGWADPFSSAELTRRQTEYAESFRNNSIYTPQMVVDGRREFVGSQERAARQAIAEAAQSPKTAVHLTISGNAEKSGIPLEVRIEKLTGAAAGNRAEIFLAITESRLHSNVAGGETSGRKLDHMSVVRTLERLGDANAQTETSFAGRPVVKLANGWNRANLRAVVFIQEKGSRHILGAAEISLN